QQSSPVFFWDERWTTVSAEKLLIETGKSPSRHRNKIDQIAAAYLLQSFLDRLNYIKRNE
ncbi:MAG: pre-16S rRNA-processing nuclease YqgF, partial [Calditrichaeota bacterium]